MINNVLVRRAAAAAIGVSVVALAPAATAWASAGHTSTETQNYHGVTYDSQINPCDGNTIDITNDTNMVFHVTSFTDSDELWFTFTEQDKITAVDEGTGVVYTGHSTTWGNENDNERNSNSTFTNSLRVTGSDGSVISGREVTHITVTANGEVSVSFDKASLTCG